MKKKIIFPTPLILALVFTALFNACSSDHSEKGTTIPDSIQKVYIFSCKNFTVVDLPGFSRNSNKIIGMWAYNHGVNQKWTIEKKEDVYQIRSELSGFVLTANPNDSTVVQQAYTANNNQQWILTAKNDTFQIQNAGTGLYLTETSDIEQKKLKLKPFEGGKDQQWMISNADSEFTNRIYGSYLKILKRAGEYNFNEQNVFPKFQYQDSYNPNLVHLREKYKLDSIAGTGNEITQILNLLSWVHKKISHDGQHGNPSIVNAESMFAVCEKENRGLNCRGLAMALNECYLAMGFKSRLWNRFDCCHLIIKGKYWLKMNS